MIKKKIFLLLLILILSSVFVPNLLAQVIPFSRRIAWNPGVQGGIPQRSTVCATLPLGSTASQIQAKLNLATCQDKVVQLEAGEYSLNAKLQIPSRVTLRGMGMRGQGNGGTVLKGTASFSGDTMISFDGPGFDGGWKAPEIALVSPVKAADESVTTSTITTATAHGWLENDIILIDMGEQTGDASINKPVVSIVGASGNCTWCGRPRRPIGQWVKVLSKTATTVTVEPALYFSYGASPKGLRMTGRDANTGAVKGLTEFAGVENLTLNNLSSKTNDTVGVFGAVNSWLYKVEMLGNNRRAFWGYGALWFTIQGCRIVGGIPLGADLDPQYTSDSAYGVFFGPHFSASLVTDNIFEKLTNAMAFEGAAAGNVFSYNYMTDMWWRYTEDSADQSDYPRRFGALMHGSHPIMNLLEGNFSEDRFRADENWGSSSHFTLLRNRIKQNYRGNPSNYWNSEYSQSWTIDLERGNWFYNLVGNVLGVEPPLNPNPTTDAEREQAKEAENYYELRGESISYTNGPKAIYKLGYESLGDTNTRFDAAVGTGLIRYHNWVSRLSNTNAGSGVEGSTHELPGTKCLSNCVIPASYYLSQRPDWFADSTGSLKWPPIGPELTPRVCPIPAQVRYYQMYSRTFTVPANCRPGTVDVPPGSPGALRVVP